MFLAFLADPQEMSSESHPRETKTDIRPTSRCGVQPNSVRSARGAAKIKMIANPEGHRILQVVKRSGFGFVVCLYKSELHRYFGKFRQR